MGCQIVIATKWVRLRGTSVPAGEQPTSQLPSFLSDTHLLYIARAPPPIPHPQLKRLVLHRTHGDEPVSPSGLKARIWLEKHKSFRGVSLSTVSFRLERSCLAKRQL